MNKPEKLTAEQEHNLDRLLKQSFEPGQALSADFESSVMESIRQQHQRSDHGRRVFITMMCYWAVASLTGAWLLAGDLPLAMDAGDAALKTVVSVVVVVGLSAVFVVRQSSLRLSDLFLRTIQ